MICLNCFKPLKNNLSFRNLVTKERHAICDKCFSKEHIKVESIAFPLESGILQCVSLFACMRETKPDAWMSFLEPFYKIYQGSYQTYTLVVLDQLDQKYFDILDACLLGDIFVITLIINIKGA